MAEPQILAAKSRPNRGGAEVSFGDDLDVEDFGLSRGDGSRADSRDMQRMGKQQELKVL